MHRGVNRSGIPAASVDAASWAVGVVVCPRRSKRHQVACGIHSRIESKLRKGVCACVTCSDDVREERERKFPRTYIRNKTKNHENQCDRQPGVTTQLWPKAFEHTPASINHLTASRASSSRFPSCLLPASTGVSTIAPPPPAAAAATTTDADFAAAACDAVSPELLFLGACRSNASSSAELEKSPLLL